MLAILADEYREDTRRCDPPIELLVRETKMSRSSVNRALDNLEADRFIRIDRRYGARFRITFTLEHQMKLRAVEAPPARPKRRTGFATRQPERGDDNPCQGDMGSDVEFLENRSQPEIGLPAGARAGVAETDRSVTSNRSQAEIATDLRLRSQVPGPGPGESTATAAPRLPFPIGLKPPRPADVAAKLAAEHRVAKLRRRIAGCAIGLLLHPERGVALIQEPVTNESLLRAAVIELCARRRVAGYRDVDPSDGMEYVTKTVASVWWKHTAYGIAVIAGKAPRPRDVRNPFTRRPR